MIHGMHSHNCTIYLKQSEGVYARQVVEGVHWEDTRGANFNRTGVSSVDSVTVSIPLEKANLDAWGPSSAGYIVRGIWDDEILDAAGLKSFLAKKPFTITSVAKHDYSIVIGNHWKVGAK